MSAPRVAVVMGVSGSGKTTLARNLSDAWPAVFLDADDFHDDAAKARMASGRPLTDAMRVPWVVRVADAIVAHAGVGDRVVLAFSGLRRAHRDVLRGSGLPLRFLHLHGDRALIAARMQARRGHYMPAALLDSQFDALERTDAEADVVMLAIDMSPGQQLQQALSILRGAT
ncbi:gluconokinase [Luteimonas aestuarii]|uniref:Gluconokinase n=1 Tax=Luteimonas aestuarii TaxID=453837 RepID=A0A4R5TT63_9GAMM|nr:gluconokinase, GntK/IdnK-type [Luteimonas aestuarii]TDK22974.1 gluconokinase [Luteimonas aestuarii]